ncbi:putative WD-repeat protein [Hibiscus syriacus]|uniref:WD-repeat protein n=1 Tax=Hibiscus syriacus TaxID=106335 RepID=A0A6A2WM86_HIBSY|nr:protein BIC1-like [Hibiscus syriacus]KAE8661153.1 putative WD-repeat protein [Hibiscus syriacus]
MNVLQPQDMENTTHHHRSPLQPQEDPTDDGSSGMEICECEGSSLKGRRRRSSSEAESDDFKEDDDGREKLKRHRIEVAGRVWIPEIWGQEELLKDWIDSSAFDDSLVPRGIMSARAALVEEGRRANSGRFRIENRC